MKHTRKTIVAALLAIATGAQQAIGSVAWAAPAAPATPAAVTIVVTTTDDPNPTSLTETCGYTQGAFFVPAAPCSLRRALREASARPRADLPIAVTFNITTADPGYNAALDLWTITLAATALELRTPSIANLSGQVTLDGATQPGGRATGPKIMINTSDVSLAVRSRANVIRNLGFYGGGVIDVYESNNLIENVWMGLSADGQNIVFRTPLQPQRMAGGGIVLRSDNNIVRNNVISGAFARAVNIDGGDNNQVLGNLIGTRADGSVPAVPDAIVCNRSTSATAGSWYGGWGIATSGISNTISNNRIAGLHIVQTANSSPPMAIEIFGSNHTVQNNIIGVDVANSEVGVCGQGIKVSGNNTVISDNTIVKSRKGFEGDSKIDAAILASDSSPTFDAITVRRNIVKESAGRVYSFNLNTETMATFKPAKITQISGVTVSGGSGDGSPCPNCLIDFYTDDTDGLEEALTYVGSTTADASGNFVFTLPAPLAADSGLRTISTPQQAAVIGSYNAGSSTLMSPLYTATKKLYMPVTIRS